MTVVLTDINMAKRQSNNYLADCDEDMLLPLYEYLNTAEKCIGAFASPSVAHDMLQDEDAISFIAEHLIMGSARWKPDMEGGRSHMSYIIQCARWAIPRWIEKCSKAYGKHVQSLNYCHGDEDTHNQLYEMISDPRDVSDGPMEYWYEVEEQVNTLLQHPDLTKAQSESIRLRFVEGKTFDEVGKAMGFSKQGASNHVQSGLRKLVSTYGETV